MHAVVMFRHSGALLLILGALGESLDLRFEPRITESDEIVFTLEDYWDDILRPHNSTLASFDWNQCGPNDVVRIQSLTVEPDKLRIPGSTTVSFTATVSEPVRAPLQVSLGIKKKLIKRYHRIPCIHHAGSCTYSDVCQMLQEVHCPSSVTKQGMSCRCPFKSGDYSLARTAIPIPKIPHVPHFIIKGHYKIRAVASHQGQQVLCFEAAFQIA